MHRTIDYFSHLPDFYEQILEMKEIGKALDEKMKKIADENSVDLLDSFILTASEQSIAIWEKEIGMKNSAGMSIEHRRKRLINRYTTKPPFTMRWLENQLRELLGDGFIKIDRDDDVEILYIYYDLNAVQQFRESEAIVERVLPLSMNYFKNIRGYKILENEIYVGSTLPMHLHIEIAKA